jgi:hypothetical protein
MRRSVVPLALAAVLALGACGSSGSSNAGPSTPETSVQQLSSPSYEKAGPTPSASAKMICQKEAQGDIASSLNVTAHVSVPTWNESQHLYSCVYAYSDGNVVLSVKEMSNEAETTAYFNGIIKKYGTTDALIGLGQGAWVLKNGDVVARKDYKVLFVNAQGIPAQFSTLLKRSDTSISIATAIMGCWSGS